MQTRFGQGDIVRVVGGPGAGRQGAIYDGVGAPRREPWVRTDEAGRAQYRVYFDLPDRVDAGWYDEDSLALVKAMPGPIFRTGDRVRIKVTAFWAQGEAGTVNAGGWDASLTPLIRHRSSGPTYVHVVHVDHPHRDADGDGPFIVGSFDESELDPLVDASDRPPAYPAARLAAEAEALRKVMANPELGQRIRRGRPGPKN